MPIYIGIVVGRIYPHCGTHSVHVCHKAITRWLTYDSWIKTKHQICIIGESWSKTCKLKDDLKQMVEYYLKKMAHTMNAHEIRFTEYNMVWK